MYRGWVFLVHHGLNREYTYLPAQPRSLSSSAVIAVAEFESMHRLYRKNVLRPRTKQKPVLADGLCKYLRKRLSLGFGFLFLRPLGLFGFLALGFGLGALLGLRFFRFGFRRGRSFDGSLDPFEDGELSSIALALVHLDDPRVAAIAVLEYRREFVEENLRGLFAVQTSGREPAF